MLNSESRVAYGDTWVRHRYAEKIEKMARTLEEELRLLEMEISEKG